jgi:hypothetical protein
MTFERGVELAAPMVANGHDVVHGCRIRHLISRLLQEGSLRFVT